jgi:hypothetical protein
VVKTIGIKNIRTQQRAILHKISHLAASPTANSAEIQGLTQTINQAVATIEKICTTAQTTPASLTSTSRQIYGWMKFLTVESNLQLHLHATHRLKRIAQIICDTHRQDLVNFMIEVTNIAVLYKARTVKNSISLMISEGFINASDDVLLALVKDALLGKTKHTTQITRDFAYSEEYSSVLLELDLIVEVIAENAKGKSYDLDQLFNKINCEYFAASLTKPRLTWSQIQTYRKFGHYEPVRDRVVVSLTLDDANIPEFVVEFVLYHELLHKYHGAKLVNNKRMVHTSEFRAWERQFKFYNEADAWLHKLACHR